MHTHHFTNGLTHSPYRTSQEGDGWEFKFASPWEWAKEDGPLYYLKTSGLQLKIAIEQDDRMDKD